MCVCVCVYVFWCACMCFGVCMRAPARVCVDTSYLMGTDSAWAGRGHRSMQESGVSVAVGLRSGGANAGQR
jgi:hypothetical protein